MGVFSVLDGRRCADNLGTDVWRAASINADSAVSFPMLCFTIRDMLWLMVVVALGLALWNERRRLSAVTVERDQKVMHYERLEYAVLGTGWEPEWNDAHDNVTMIRRR